jgi:hypothetical protein
LNCRFGLNHFDDGPSVPKVLFSIPLPQAKAGLNFPPSRLIQVTIRICRKSETQVSDYQWEPLSTASDIMAAPEARLVRQKKS